MSYIIFKCKNKKERLCVIMLKPAILFKDQIDRKFLEMYYTKEMRYYSSYIGCNCTPEISPEPMENRYDWAIVDDDDPEKLLGYIGYRHYPVVDSIENFGLFSFDPGNYKVGKEVFNLLEKCIKSHHRVSWSAIGDNPTLHNYIKFCKRHNGDYVVLHDITIDEDGNYVDNYIFEVINPKKGRMK